MEGKIPVIALLWLTLTWTLCLVKGQTQDATIASCLEGTSATELIATFRVDKNGADVTEVTAYSQDGLTAQTGVCTTGFTGDFAELAITIDTTGTLPCGIEVDGTVPNQYNIRVHVLGPSVDQTYTFYCILPGTENTVTTGALTVNGKLAVYSMYERTRKVTFLARYTENDLPVTAVPLGQSIYYSLTLDKGSVSYENTNWGRKFHVSFLQNTYDPAKLSLTIYTPGPGTRVRIIGNKAGDTFDETISVTRDSPESEFCIPSGYLPATGADDVGISIEGIDDIIGVVVNNAGDTENTGSYVAIPDEALEAGTYRIQSYTEDYADSIGSSQIVIVGIEASTSVTINDPGIKNTAGSTSVTITNSRDTYTHICATSCEGIAVTSDKPLAIISGGKATTYTTANMVTPALPNTKFGSKFVIVNFPSTISTNTAYKPLLETANIVTTVNWFRPSGSGGIKDDNPPILLTGGVAYTAEELQIDPAENTMASLAQFIIGTPSLSPSMLVIPPVEGWGTEQVFSLSQGVTYEIVLVAPKGEAGNIVKSTTTDMTGASISSLGVSLSDVTAITGAANYEVGPHSFSSASGEHWVKFKSATPFMALGYEFHSDGRLQALTPFGQRTPTINPAGGCIPAVELGGIYPGVRMGNGQDDDCDGAVDEELPNGIDDDGDGKIDEDTSTTATMGGDIVGISNTGLSLAADAAGTLPAMVAPVDVIFASGQSYSLQNATIALLADISSSLQTALEKSAPQVDEVISAPQVGLCKTWSETANTGFLASWLILATPMTKCCNAHAGSDVTKDVIASVGHFTASATDNTNYPDHYTIRTSDFMAFRFTTEPALWAKATVNLHDDTTGVAADSCAARRRKRRDVGSRTRQETVYLNLNIVDIPDNDTVTEKTQTATETCVNDVTYWSAATVLLVILVSEIAISTVLRREKFQTF